MKSYSIDVSWVGVIDAENEQHATDLVIANRIKKEGYWEIKEID